MKVYLKFCWILIIVFGLNSDLYAELTDKEKANISKNVAAAISKTGVDLIDNETTGKLVNRIVSDTLYLIASAVPNSKILVELAGGDTEKFLDKFWDFQDKNKIVIKPPEGYKYNVSDYVFVITDVLVNYWQSTIKDEPTKIIVEFTYGEIKAGVKYLSGDKVGATVDFAGNAVKLGYKSTKGILKLSKEYGKLLAKDFDNKRTSKSTILTMEYMKYVGKAKKKNSKKKFLDEFYDKCVKENYVNPNRIAVIFNFSAATIQNRTTKMICKRYQDSIVDFENKKLSYLTHSMTKGSPYSYEEYKQYLDDYFPSEDVEYLKELYDVNNNYVDVKLKAFYYPHVLFLKKMNIITYKNRYFFRPKDYITQFEALVMITNLLYKQEYNTYTRKKCANNPNKKECRNQEQYRFSFIKEKISNKLPVNYPEGLTKKITRIEIAEILAQSIFVQLDDKLLPSSVKDGSYTYTIEKLNYETLKGQIEINKGWNIYSAFLRAIHITNGYNSGPKKGKFGKDDLIKRGEMATMISKTYKFIERSTWK